MIRWLFQFVGDLFFPTFCVGCKRLGKYLCNSCYNELTFYSLPLKLKLEHQYVDELFPATEYAPPISQLVHQLKYQSMIGIAEYCAWLLYYTTFLPPADFVTAVPLHPQRQCERGFNQAEEIARHLALHLKIPYLQTLKRLRHVSSQASLKKKTERLTHLQNLFALYPRLPPEKITQKTLLLVDDVATTGTTLNECAKVLKQNGAAKVYGIVIAHGS